MNVRSFIFSMLAVVALPYSATANVPDPSRSHVPMRLVSCPAGDSTFVVIVRFATGEPWAKTPIDLTLCSCGGYRLSRDGVHPYTVDATGCVVFAQGDPLTGAASFPLAGGGLCPGDSILVDAGGVWLGFTHAVSLDQDGNLAVDAADVAIVQSKVGTSDMTADFDGDGQVTAADVAIEMAHLGHHAADATTAVAPQASAGLAMSAPRPNPFRNEANFGLTLVGEASVDVAVYDLGGRRVASVYDGVLGGGTHDFTWSGRRADGSVTDSGLYFLRATVDGKALARRVVFLAGR